MNVYVLSITHRFGTDLRVFEKEDSAEAALLEYVTEWWTDVHPDEDIDSYDDPISAYFDDSDGEYYLLEVTELER